MKSFTIAAIQMETTFCDTDANLLAAEQWIRDAQKLGAQWIMLPEFFTSGLAWDPRMSDAWEPIDGKPMQMLKRMAKEGATVVGGSYLAHDGAHIRNTLVLAMPDGRTFTHDKDIPSIGESCYCAGKIGMSAFGRCDIWRVASIACTVELSGLVRTNR